MMYKSENKSTRCRRVDDVYQLLVTSKTINGIDSLWNHSLFVGCMARFYLAMNRFSERLSFQRIGCRGEMLHLLYIKVEEMVVLFWPTIV